MPADFLDGVHPNASAQTFVKDMSALQEAVHNRILRAQAYQKHYADKKRQDVQFEVGDKVYLSAKHIRLTGSRNLLPRFLGPF